MKWKVIISVRKASSFDKGLEVEDNQSKKKLSEFKKNLHMSKTEADPVLSIGRVEESCLFFFFEAGGGVMSPLAFLYLKFNFFLTGSRIFFHSECMKLVGSFQKPRNRSFLTKVKYVTEIFHKARI